ncbi:MAG: SDR family NAD(P)-dependent oxidoreductase [Candidatus Staskawiczbacteria bacterium]|nr:SDR family NAD(P)-dependent oxidoreductase [Candidatus Staskawiczbacteria bacterium]
MKNKKVLITGGAGFIGSNFVYKFLDLGCKINVVEKEKANFWRLKEVKNKIKIDLVDLENYDKIELFVAKTKPDIILHFATYGVFQARQQDIKITISTNLLGTINLVNACSKINFECFINTGSASEYGAKDKLMEENDLLEPNNLYGITKVASTLYCQYMARKTGLPIVTARLSAPYGYFEEKGRLIPTIIKSCLENGDLNLSSPASVRDFIFIEDIVTAYLEIIENIQKVKGEIFNIGPGVQTTIDQVVNIIKEITHSSVEPKYGQIKPAQIEPKNWLSNISKIKKILGWQPRYSLEKGLEKNISWFKKNINLYN